MEMSNAEPNTVLKARAVGSSDSDTSRYAFQAQSYYTLGETRLDKCLLGAVNYANRAMRITFAHKLEEWLFCAEQNLLINEGVYVGAFHNGRHYSFDRLCDISLPLQQEAWAFQKWIFDHVLSLFYPEGLPIRLSGGPLTVMSMTPHSLKECRIVPNEQAVSDFIRENPTILPL